jgi:hypothetical protein
MRESLKLQCRVDDVIDKEWRESETLNAEMITEALLLIIADLVDDIESEDELAPLIEMLEEVAGDIKSKVNDLGAEEDGEEGKDDGVGPLLCKIHFRKYVPLGDCKKQGCSCCSK